MKKTKQFSFINDFSGSLSALEAIDDAVKITLGPTGKNGLLYTKTSEIKYLTSGSAILNAMEWSNYSQNILSQLVAESAKKTELISGDGSTTTILLTCQLLKTCGKFLTNGYNSVILSSGLKKIAHFCSERVGDFAWPIQKFSHLYGILKTATGKKLSNELRQLISSSIGQLGRDGLIFVEENSVAENELEIVQGIELEKGFASSYFVTDLKKFEATYENPYLLLASHPITSINQLKDIISYIKSVNRSLIIIAEEITPDILSTLVLNTIQKKIKVVVIKYNSIKFIKTGILEDLAILSHSSYFVPEKKKLDSRNFAVSDLGQVEKAIIQKEKSTFLISKFSKLLAKRRIDELNRELLTSETEYEKSLLQTRIARLSGNIAKIKLAPTNTYQFEEERQKIEKAISTIRSSLEEGILPGGGIFYLKLRNEIKQWAVLNLLGDEIVCSNIVTTALERPFYELCNNTNMTDQKVTIFSLLEKLKYPYAYNFSEKQIGHSLKSGVVDSAKSVRAALWNSFSITSSIIACE